MNPVLSIPESAWQVSRREFLQRLGGAAAAAAALPGSISAAFNAPPTTPSLKPGISARNKNTRYPQRRDEAFWKLVKEQFILREGLILMNAANLCPSPISVIETVFGYLRDEYRDASFQNRAKYDELRKLSRAKLAQLLGASPEEIALVRNTSEGNNVVVNALNLKPGDEVLLWDQNHPTNNVAWRVRAARHGFTVRSVSLGWPPSSVEEILEHFRKGFTAHTKVLAFSDVSNVSGTALAVKELCAIARERGVITHIDGAQTFGVKNLSLHEIGCDSYAGSTHKWLMGPKEAGVFYVRKERIQDYWPLVVGAGWGTEVAPRPKGARKFESLGQRNDATLAAVGKAVDFYNLIREGSIESRTRELATALKEDIARIPGAKLYTSLNPALSLGVVVFNLGGAVNHEKAYMQLYEQYGVGSAFFPGREPKLRLCPHIYNTMEQVEKVLAALHIMAARGG